MTDRHYAIVVIFDESIREDDFEESLKPIFMAIKGVISVQPVTEDMNSIMAKEQARRELINKLWEVLK